MEQLRDAQLVRVQRREQELRHNQDASRIIAEQMLYSEFRGGYCNSALHRKYRNQIDQLMKELDYDRGRYTSLMMMRRPLSITEELFINTYNEKEKTINDLRKRLESY